MKTRSPIRWFGGKHYLASAIINLMPQHRCYVEPFGGGAHVLSQKPVSPIEVYNDIDDDVVNFLLELKKSPKQLAAALEKLPYARSLYDKWKWEDKPDDSFERAVRWFYVHRCKIEAGNNHRSGWRHSKERNPVRDYRAAVSILNKFEQRFRNVQIECIDFRKIIETYDGPHTLFYVDPPYRGREFRYKGKFTEKDHIDLAHMLKNIKGKAIVSYYSDSLIDDLYRDWYLETIDTLVGGVKQEKRREEKELLFTNYESNQMSIFDFTGREGNGFSPQTTANG